MKAYNIYFSPTGGTKKVGDAVALALLHSFEDIDLIKKDCFERRFDGDDICVISVPAFGGRVPQNAAEKLRSFKGSSARAVIVAVFGNRAIDDTLIELYDLATAAGFQVIGGIEAVAEHSLARIYAHGRPSQADCEELSSFAEIIKSKLLQKDNTPPKLPGNRPYKEQKSMGMSPYVDEGCTNCKKCALECPADAIPTDNIKAIDTARCFSCLHCVAVCPQNARHNSREATRAFEERLRDRCEKDQKNKLYI